MHVTLEQARVFESVARLGTIQKAAAELNKGHSAILYSLKSLEDQIRLKLFDRSGYRNQVTLQGDMVLRLCRELLETEAKLKNLAQQISQGWELSLKFIYDDVIDFNLIADAFFKLDSMQPPTEVKVQSAHLHEVEEVFARERADFMATILPIAKWNGPSIALPPHRMLLVAHKDHPLAKKSRRRLNVHDLSRHTFVAIRKTAGLVGFGTENVPFNSQFFVNSFSIKKIAILKRLGFGWLPDFLIDAELKRGTLVVLKTELENSHTLHPRLYHQSQDLMGRAGRELLRAFSN